jgi:hypothetical protein
MAKNTPTPEEIEAARAMVAEADRVAAEEAQARHNAYLAPVRDLIASEAWTTVLDKLNEIREGYAADDSLSVHVDALAEIMPRLVGVVPASPVPVVQPQASEPEPEA